MEYKKNANTVKLLFKMKNIEKLILNMPQHLRGIRAEQSSMENYNRCFNIYTEASSNFYQCCGFLKSHYFENIPSTAGKNFFINSLYVPTYKKFLNLRQNLSLVEVKDIYTESFKLLQEKVDYINSSLSELLNEVSNMQ